MTLFKTLKAIGNSYGLIIDKPILQLLSIEPDTRLKVTTDGKKLIIEPWEEDFDATAESILKRYDEMFKELAK